MMTTERIIRHATLPIFASASIWSAHNWQLYSNSDVAARHTWDHNVDELLAIALANGLTGEQALAYASVERNRRTEAESLRSAIQLEATAIASLASALVSEREQEVVSRVVSRLSERTQYAVRQQLAGTGLLSR